MSTGVRVIAIIAARMDSTRLPGKVIRNLNGVSILNHVIARALRIKNCDEVFVATTSRPIDDPVVLEAIKANVKVYRGDVQNVANRFWQCANVNAADYFVRVNADSPFIDPAIVDYGIELAVSQLPDYVTNLVGRTFPYGISAEIISTKALGREIALGLSKDEQEHVTAVFNNHPDRFNIISFSSSSPDLKVARLTVDTEEDFERLNRVAMELNEPSACHKFEDISRFLLMDNA